MLHDLKTISLTIAFIFPFMWGITFLLSGLKNQSSRVYLFFLMIVASFAYMMTFFKFEGYINIYANLFPYQAGTVFSLFPLMYCYVKSLTSEKEIKKMAIYLHFIPSIFVFVTVLVMQRIMVQKEYEIDFVRFLLDKDVEIRSNFVIGKTVYDIYKKLFIIISMIYVVAQANIVRKHYIKVRDLFSEDDKSELRWIKGIGVIFIVMIVFFVIIHILENNQVEAQNGLIGISYLTFGLFFWYLGLNGFRQKEVYNVSEVAQADEFKAEAKISKSKIENYLLRTKAYQNQNISVFDMCYHFHTNRTYLSDAIKLNFNTNFRGLINHYRTEDAKKAIDENVANNIDFDLENISTNAGFSSYSTFFRVFRAETGITPSDYIKFITKQKKKS